MSYLSPAGSSDFPSPAIPKRISVSGTRLMHAAIFIGRSLPPDVLLGPVGVCLEPFDDFPFNRRLRVGRAHRKRRDGGSLVGHVPDAIPRRAGGLRHVLPIPHASGVGAAVVGYGYVLHLSPFNGRESRGSRGSQCRTSGARDPRPPRPKTPPSPLSPAPESASACRACPRRYTPTRDSPYDASSDTRPGSRSRRACGGPRVRTRSPYRRCCACRVRPARASSCRHP